MNRILTTASPRAYPHVSGPSTRYKAEPIEITRLAARVMCASGSFTTKRAPARSSSGLLPGLVVFLLAAGTLAVAGDARPVDRDGRRAGTQIVLPDEMISLGMGEYRGYAAAPEAGDLLDAQDRFEIARLFRLTAAASQELAPGAGPPQKEARRAAR